MKQTKPVSGQTNATSDIAEELPDIDIKIAKYGDSRFFAIWLNGELLAVTVYKKGAVAIRNVLMRR